MYIISAGQAVFAGCIFQTAVLACYVTTFYLFTAPGNFIFQLQHIPYKTCVEIAQL